METRKSIAYFIGGFYWLAYYGLTPFRSCPSGIAQIDLVVQAVPGEIRLVSGPEEKFLYLLECSGLIIVTSDMHTLDTQPFIICKELCAGKVLMLFLLSLPYRPVKLFFCYKLRQPDHGDPSEAFFVRVVDPGDAVLPSQSFQGRDYIRKIAFDPVVSFITHLDGK